MENKERTQLSCETISTTDFLTEQLGIKTYSLTSVSQKIIMVHFHIIRINDGTGGLSTSQVDQVLENLQLAMEQASICIAEKGRSFIDNTTFYNSNPSVTFKKSSLLASLARYFFLQSLVLKWIVFRSGGLPKRLEWFTR